MLAFALKNWKFVVAGLAVLLISGLTFWVQTLQSKLAQVKSDNKNLFQLYSDDHRNLDYYQSKFNQEVAKNQSLELSHRAIQELIESRDHQWLQQFEGLKKSMRNLTMAQQVSARAYDSLKVLLELDSSLFVNSRGDTIHFIFTKFNYQDEYAKIKATQISPDSAVVVYNINVPLQQAIYWQRKWFLGKKSFTSEVTSPNKKIKITKLETIFVGKKKRRND